MSNQKCRSPGYCPTALNTVKSQHSHVLHTTEPDIFIVNVTYSLRLFPHKSSRIFFSPFPKLSKGYISKNNVIVVTHYPYSFNRREDYSVHKLILSHVVQMHLPPQCHCANCFFSYFYNTTNQEKKSLNNLENPYFSLTFRPLLVCLFSLK